MRQVIRAVYTILFSLMLVGVALFAPQGMAITQTLTDIEEVQRISINATYDVLEVPPGTQYLILLGSGADFFYKVGCTDGDAAPGADYEFYAADTPVTRAVGYAIQQGKTICVGAGAAATLQVTPTVAAP